MNKKDKSISAFFFFKHPESVGNVVVIHTLNYIADHFDTIIYSNQGAFLKKLFPGFKIICLDHLRSSNIPFFGMMIYWRKIAGILNADSSEAVFLGHNVAPIALWLNKTSFQYVYQVHEMLGYGIEKKSFFKRKYQKVLEFFILKGIKKSKANFAVSVPIMQYLASHKVTNLILTPHCVDLRKFSEPDISAFHSVINEKRRLNYFIVCYTGWVSEKRGLFLMLESLYISVKKDAKVFLVVAGSDSENTFLISKYFRDNNMVDNCLCLGKIKYDYIPGVIALSDVCLSFLEDNPVYQMSPPQKVIEYFASGKPVIANDIQTHALLITDAYDGFLTPYDPAVIAERILFLKDNSGIHDTMCKNALITAAKYDTPAVYQKMEEAINNMLYIS